MNGWCRCLVLCDSAEEVQLLVDCLVDNVQRSSEFGEIYPHNLSKMTVLDVVTLDLECGKLPNNFEHAYTATSTL